MVDKPDSDSDEEFLQEPPAEGLVYRRNWKDKLKLIILPPLYFSFMVTAAVVAFFTIDALVLSYNHRVRSIEYITIEKYHTIGIAMFPEEYSTFDYCKFNYADDLYPGDHSSTDHPNEICHYTNVTFFSQLVKKNRSAIVFDGPTLVRLKQSLIVHFTLDTTMRNYSAMEYLLLGNWHTVMKESTEKQAIYLSGMEARQPLFTVPAGFRTWVKMSYTIRNDGAASNNLSDFDVKSDLSSYNDWRNISERTTSPILALFEWKTDTFEYVTVILSTTIWNTIGALSGVFITFIKVGEYAHRWIKRLRREKRKKVLKLTEIEEQHKRKLDQYWQKKMERKLNRLTSSKAS